MKTILAIWLLLTISGCAMTKYEKGTTLIMVAAIVADTMTTDNAIFTVGRLFPEYRNTINIGFAASHIAAAINNHGVER